MPDEAPQLLVLAESPRVGAHRGLDRQHVPAQGLGLRPRTEKVPGLIARKGLRHGCYPSPASGPEPRRSHHGKAPDRGRGAVVRHDRARRQQERSAAAARVQPPHRRGGRAAQRPAHPGRRRDAARCSPTSACSVDWRGENTVSLQADAGPRAPTSTPSLAERIRASFLAAGPLLGRFGSRADAAARRRRDRPPPARPAPRRLPRARRDRRARAATSASSPATAACRPATSSWTSRP